jgi:hypothetical protein
MKWQRTLSWGVQRTLCWVQQVKTFFSPTNDLDDMCPSCTTMSDILENHGNRDPPLTDSDGRDDFSDASQLSIAVPTGSTLFFKNMVPLFFLILTLADLCKDDSENTSSLSGFSSDPLRPLTSHIEAENTRLKKDVKSYKHEVQQLQHNLANLNGKLEAHMYAMPLCYSYF